MQAAQPRRLRLPNRRTSTTFVIQCDGIVYTTSYLLFSSGALGEIFLSSAKAGWSADNAAGDSAIAAWLALQGGVDVETLRRPTRHTPTRRAQRLLSRAGMRDVQQ
jgi:hypothetical protein